MRTRLFSWLGIIDEFYIVADRSLLLLIESLVDDYPELSGRPFNNRERFHGVLLARSSPPREQRAGSPEGGHN